MVVALHDYKKQEAEVINFKKKGAKLKKDGTPKNTISGSVKGNPHEVYPIKSKEEIGKFIQYFIDEKDKAVSEFDKKTAARNLMMFVVGINVALRASDLLKLKWTDIFDGNGEFYDFTRLKEQKTGKFKNLSFNSSVKNAIMKYVDEFKPDIKSDSYLFKSREKGCLSVEMAGKILSNAAKEIGIQYNVASHTMRKTFSYWFMQNNKEDMAYALAKLQHILNHGSSATTLKYIGMTDDENKKYYENNTLGMY